MCAVAELILTKKNHDDVVAHALSSLPNEGCGYLAGHGMRVMAFYPMTNVQYSPDYFEMDHAEQQEVLAQIESQGLHPLAIYHSHPQMPAHLSREDIKWANDFSLAIVIVSLREMPKVKAYAVRKPLENHVEIEQLTVTVE